MSEIALPKTTRWFELTWRHKLWRLQQLGWIMQDVIGTARQPEHDHRTHLRATLEWLCRAQDVYRSSPHSGCVVEGWAFELGWLSGSIDDTGWLIETFLPAANYLDWPALNNRARIMLDALLNQPDSTSLGRIHGLMTGHLQMGDTSCLPRAVQSGYALLEISASSTTQHAQLAQTLIRLGILAQNEDLLQAGRTHLEAALAAQTPCGWFADDTAPVSTLSLASIVRCVLDTAELLPDLRGQSAARQAAWVLSQQLSDSGALAAHFDDGWTPSGAQACVTGMAQLAISWLRLAQLEPQSCWREAAWIALAWIKRNQCTTTHHLALRDALPGAVPIWQGPNAFHFTAISAKYFADALMMDMVGITIPPNIETRPQA